MLPWHASERTERLLIDRRSHRPIDAENIDADITLRPYILGLQNEQDMTNVPQSALVLALSLWQGYSREEIRKWYKTNLHLLVLHGLSI